MERLTIADEKLPNGYIRRTLIDGYKVREHAMDFYWALKKYEDTGYGPEIFARVYAPETPFEIALDAEVHKLRMENVRLTTEQDAEKRRPENPPLTSKQVMALDDLDAVWMYSWGRSTHVTVESGRCAKMMLECPPKQQATYGSDWWFFAHKPLYTDIIEAVRHHSDC